MADDITPQDPTTKSRRAKKEVGALPPDAAALDAIVKGLARLKVQDILPDELTYATLVAHVAKVAETRKTDGAALAHRVGSNRTLAELETDLANSLTRIDGIIAIPHPAGSATRVDFYVPGPGPHDDCVRMARVIEGCKKHPLKDKSVPADLKLPKLETLLASVLAAREAKKLATQQKDGTATPKVSLSQTTREYLSAVTKFLRSFYGAKSPTLTEFGIKPSKR